MKKRNIKTIIATISLIILILMVILLTYFKFFATKEIKIEERPISNSSSNAINKALLEITTNFNKNKNVLDYSNTNDVILKASVNNYSIFISYIAEETTTYEFTYSNKDKVHISTITGEMTEEEQQRFNLIYRFLIEAVQLRIGNEENIESIINDFLVTDTPCNGLEKKKVKEGNEYYIYILENITKLEKEK